MSTLQIKKTGMGFSIERRHKGTAPNENLDFVSGYTETGMYLNNVNRASLQVKPEKRCAQTDSLTKLRMKRDKIWLVR